MGDSLVARVGRSFSSSVGTIVFGMEDGTVSIFGLVFGVAASAPSSHTVLVAGATGAAAAAVSMMAGTFLDVQSANDQARVKRSALSQQAENDPKAADETLRTRLVAAGFSSSDAQLVLAVVDAHRGSGRQRWRSSKGAASRSRRRIRWSNRSGCW